MADLTSHARGLVEAFNDADWDATRKYFGESTYHELGTQRSLTGAGPVVEALQAWKAAMPDVRGTVTGAIEEGDRVVLEIMWEGSPDRRAGHRAGHHPGYREAAADAGRVRLRLRGRPAG